MLLTKFACYLGVVWQLWESEGMITSPTQELVTEEGKDTRYETKRFEVDIGGFMVALCISDVKYFNPYPTAFPYGNGMVLHFYQQQESSTTKTVHKVINKGLKTYV